MRSKDTKKEKDGRMEREKDGKKGKVRRELEVRKGGEKSKKRTERMRGGKGLRDFRRKSF